MRQGLRAIGQRRIGQAPDGRLLTTEGLTKQQQGIGPLHAEQARQNQAGTIFWT